MCTLASVLLAPLACQRSSAVTASTAASALDASAAGEPLELFRVDDTVNAFEHFDEAQPGNSGCAVISEDVRLGPGKQGKSAFLRCVMRPGEALDAARSRFVALLATQPMPATAPATARFGVQEVVDRKQGGSDGEPQGFRSWILVGPSEIKRANVQSAVAREVDDGLRRGWNVDVKLDAEGTAALRSLTHAWIGRRLAFVVNGDVVSAPVVQAEIANGTVSIGLAPGADSTTTAKVLVARLSPPAAP